MTQTKSHTNKETVRKCPYCEEEVLSRGLHAHVFNTEGSGHGPRDSTPDNFEVKDAEIVGTRSVTMVNPTEYNVEHRRYVCDYCNNSFRGKLGMKIHLGRKAGKDEVHPEDADERDPESFESYPATESGEILVETEEEAEDLEIDDPILVSPEGIEEPSDVSTIDDFSESPDEFESLLSDLEQLHERFLQEDEEDRQITPYHAAERIERLLEEYR